MMTKCPECGNRLVHVPYFVDVVPISLEHWECEECGEIFDVPDVEVLDDEWPTINKMP